MDQIILNEKIYPVIQGEGPYVSTKMLLVRLYGCNIKCPDCDTKYAWDENNVKIHYDIYRFIDYLNEKLAEFNIHDILITGGSPNLYQEQLKSVISSFTYVNFHIEDNGSEKWDEWFLSRENIFFSFSPKVGVLKPGIKVKEWKAFIQKPKNYIVKIVVNKNINFRVISDFINNYKIPKSKVYLMPYGKTREEIIENSKWIIPICYTSGYNYSTRLQILLFDNEKGK